MKDELISICDELESNFDERLECYQDRLKRIDSEIKCRVQSIKEKLPDNEDILDLEQLTIGLSRTHRLMHGKLSIIQDHGKELLGELDTELRQRIPAMKERIKKSESYEQASLEIQKESHTASSSFKDFFKAIMMYRDTPEERLAQHS